MRSVTVVQCRGDGDGLTCVALRGAADGLASSALRDTEVGQSRRQEALLAADNSGGLLAVDNLRGLAIVTCIALRDAADAWMGFTLFVEDDQSFARMACVTLRYKADGLTGHGLLAADYCRDDRRDFLLAADDCRGLLAAEDHRGFARTAGVALRDVADGQIGHAMLAARMAGIALRDTDDMMDRALLAVDNLSRGFELAGEDCRDLLAADDHRGFARMAVVAVRDAEDVLTGHLLCR
jgi:hypothetical protein